MSVAYFLDPVRRAVSAGLVVLASATLATMASSSARAGSSHSALYSAIVVDAVSGKVLHEDRADEHRHPASLTKVMTLFLLFEELEAGRMRLDSELLVSKHATRMEPTKLHVKAGHTISVEDSILGLVTHSANDVAVVVAESLACDEQEFAGMMTAKARELGMARTTYRNASGLPDPAQVTTARDQSILGRAIQDRFPNYFGYFSTRSFTWRGERLRNHNNLLGRVEGVDGIKTGYIRASRFNLLTSVRRDDRRLSVVVMGGATKHARDSRVESLIEQYIDQAVPRSTWNAAVRTHAHTMPEFVNRPPAHGLNASQKPLGSKE